MGVDIVTRGKRMKEYETKKKDLGRLRLFTSSSLKIIYTHKLWKSLVRVVSYFMNLT